MSYEEIQFEEKTVQLIPEDFELLSDYSWDMTGYTSRFGFFYLGNDKADVEGLTRWQAELIFQLTPPPPGMEDAFPNIENSKHIGKDKRKEIIKKTRRSVMPTLSRLCRKRICSISASFSMPMKTASMQRCISSSAGTEWIPTIRHSFWI